MGRPWFRAIAISALLAATVAGPAAAHPHAWIDFTVRVIFGEDGRVTGLRETWVFDEFYSAFATDGMDRDGDGRPVQDALDELMRLNLQGLSEFDYFTRVEAGDGRMPLAGVSETSTEFEGHRLRMSFLLEFEEPIPAGATFRYAIFDPTYYVEMLHAETSDAVVLERAPPDCRHDLEAPNPNPEMVALAYSLDQTQSAGDGLGVHFAEWVTVRCE